MRMKCLDCMMFIRKHASLITYITEKLTGPQGGQVG